MFNILNGGRHASNSTDIQEFMVAPAGVDSFAEALRAGAEIYHALGRLLVRLDQSTTVGDEGGFAPSLASNKEALDLVVQAISEAGYRPGEHCVLALDVAASELISDGEYDLAREGQRYSSDGLTALYEEWSAQYPIVSIEDGLDEEDWSGWQTLTGRLGERVQLVGDDLLVTNVDRIQRAIESRAANALLVKPNQVGSLSETLQAVNMVKTSGWGTVMSHRSGETEDTTVADLSVAWSTGQIKAGAPCRSERVAKYNRLLRIAEELGPRASYAGASVYARFKNAC
jgi:enolase